MKPSERRLLAPIAAYVFLFVFVLTAWMIAIMEWADNDKSYWTTVKEFYRDVGLAMFKEIQEARGR